ncbi:MAG: hypothetical protein R8J94_05025 [Acidimicrobiia bacterium]|nr:hypothetical protein [Acidimicrobiia bacterium]
MVDLYPRWPADCDHTAPLPNQSVVNERNRGLLRGCDRRIKWALLEIGKSSGCPSLQLEKMATRKVDEIAHREAICQRDGSAYGRGQEIVVAIKLKAHESTAIKADLVKITLSDRTVAELNNVYVTTSPVCIVKFVKAGFDLASMGDVRQHDQLGLKITNFPNCPKTGQVR